MTTSITCEHDQLLTDFHHRWNSPARKLHIERLEEGNRLGVPQHVCGTYDQSQSERHGDEMGGKGHSTAFVTNLSRNPKSIRNKLFRSVVGT